jgi:hypothetical protein
VSEILEAAQGDLDKESGLLRAQFYDETSHRITSSTALLAAVAYRLATITHDTSESDRLLQWAHKARRAVFHSIDGDGILSLMPSLASEGSNDGVEIDAEAQSYLLMLAAAWRDCVCNRICLDVYLSEIRTS